MNYFALFIVCAIVFIALDVYAKSTKKSDTETETETEKGAGANGEMSEEQRRQEQHRQEQEEQERQRLQEQERVEQERAEQERLDREEHEKKMIEERMHQEELRRIEQQRLADEMSEQQRLAEEKQLEQRQLYNEQQEQQRLKYEQEQRERRQYEEQKKLQEQEQAEFRRKQEEARQLHERQQAEAKQQQLDAEQQRLAAYYANEGITENEKDMISLYKKEKGLVNLNCDVPITKDKARHFFNANDKQFGMNQIIASVPYGVSSCDVKYTYYKKDTPFEVEGTDWRRFMYKPVTTHTPYTWAMREVGGSKSGLTAADRTVEQRAALNQKNIDESRKHGLVQLDCDNYHTKNKAKLYFNSEMKGLYSMGPISSAIPHGDYSCNMKFPIYSEVDRSSVVANDHRRFNYIPNPHTTNHTWSMGWMDDYMSGDQI